MWLDFATFLSKGCNFFFIIFLFMFVSTQQKNSCINFNDYIPSMLKQIKMLPSKIRSMKTLRKHLDMKSLVLVSVLPLWIIEHLFQKIYARIQVTRETCLLGMYCKDTSKDTNLFYEGTFFLK